MWMLSAIVFHVAMGSEIFARRDRAEHCSKEAYGLCAAKPKPDRLVKPSLLGT